MVRDLKIGVPVVTLPDAWGTRISTETDVSRVSILCLAEKETLTCYFFVSVATRTVVTVDSSLRNAGLLM